MHECAICQHWYICIKLRTAYARIRPIFITKNCKHLHIYSFGDFLYHELTKLGEGREQKQGHKLF